MTVRLYGQAPSADNGGGDPRIAFGGGPNGRKLARLAGLTVEEFHERVKCINVLSYYPGSVGKKGDKFPMREAIASATRERQKWDVGDYILFAGRNVAAAFGFPDLKWFTPYKGDCTWVLIPHPSGANHMWNFPSVVEKTSAVLKEAVDG